MKICSKCKELLPANSEIFYARKSSKDGLRGECKRCKLKQNVEYAAINGKATASYQKAYRSKNSEANAAYQKKYNKKNKETLACKKAEYKNRDKDRWANYNKEYCQKNAEDLAIKKKDRYEKNKDAILAKQKLRRKENLHLIRELERSRKRDIEKTRKRMNGYVSARYKTDEAFRLTNCLRARIRQALKNNQKAGKTIELLGCSIAFLKEHLSSRFTSGMTWDNYGDWHIDHIRPCATFDLIDPEQQRICFHYSNLQPLWAAENMAKGASWLADGAG